jgi:RNA polymerase sigma factor (sigma-70 family)
MNTKIYSQTFSSLNDAMEVIRNNSDQIYSFVSKKINSDPDFLQSLYHHLLTNIHTYNYNLPFGPWLYQCAKTLNIQHFRKTNKDKTQYEYLIRRTKNKSESPDTKIINHDLYRSVMSYLNNKFSQRDKEIFIKYAVEEYTLEHLAEEYNLSIARVGQIVKVVKDMTSQNFCNSTRI